MTTVCWARRRANNRSCPLWNTRITFSLTAAPPLSHRGEDSSWSSVCVCVFEWARDYCSVCYSRCADGKNRRDGGKGKWAVHMESWKLEVFEWIDDNGHPEAPVVVIWCCVKKTELNWVSLHIHTYMHTFTPSVIFSESAVLTTVQLQTILLPLPILSLKPCCPGICPSDTTYRLVCSSINLDILWH